MKIVPISIRKAKAFVREHHRHAPAVTGAKLAIGLEHNGRLVGVGMLGNPKARGLASDRFTAEATRVCTSQDAPKGAVSKLNSRLKRLWQLQGGIFFKSYTLAGESGASLRGAGAVIDKRVKGRRWNCASRPRADVEAPLVDKVRWDFGRMSEIPA